MRTRQITIMLGLAASLVATLGVTSCGDAGERTDGKPVVIASTNVWGDIAATVAGDDATVTALITDPDADPHAHETSALESAKLSDADLVVYNGGGYDEFAHKAVANTGTQAIEAFASRAEDIQNDDNEHVWYDLETVTQVADQIATTLAEIDPEHAAAYRTRAENLGEQLSALHAEVRELATQHRHTPVLQTEPLAHYLLLDAGMVDKTPHEFQEAIEQETDPAPAAFAATRELLTEKQVRMVLYNRQTDNTMTRNLRGTATDQHIPVVEVSETLPADTDYLTWQRHNVAALSQALNG